MWTLRMIGCLLILLAIICVLLILANWHTASLGGRDLKPLALPALLFCFLGLGLLFRRKSAALLVVIGSIGWASWLIIGSIWSVPMPWLMMNVGFGIVILIPSIAIVLKRRALVGW
jgi:hypothetical protein